MKVDFSFIFLYAENLLQSILNVRRKYVNISFLSGSSILPSAVFSDLIAHNVPNSILDSLGCDVRMQNCCLQIYVTFQN